MPHPWHDRCAWCAQPIAHAPVDDRGVLYHLGRWATREVVLAPELERERQEDVQ